MNTLSKLSRVLSPVALTALRVGLGAILVVHGWQKLQDFEAWTTTVAQLGIPVAPLFAALAMLAELAGGLGLILGFLTPIAALAVLVNMIVAIVLVHWDNGLLAQQGGYEYPLTIALAALYFVVRGAGPFSLDRVIFGRRARRQEALRGAPAHA